MKTLTLRQWSEQFLYTVCVVPIIEVLDYWWLLCTSDFTVDLSLTDDVHV